MPFRVSLDPNPLDADATAVFQLRSGVRYGRPADPLLRPVVAHPVHEASRGQAALHQYADHRAGEDFYARGQSLRLLREVMIPSGYTLGVLVC